MTDKHEVRVGAMLDGSPYWVQNIEYQRYYCNAHPNCSVSIPIQISTRVAPPTENDK